MTVALVVLGLLLIGVGLVGTVLPALPGAPVVLGGLALLAGSDGFTRVSWPTFAILAVMTGLVYLVDFASGALGAQQVGASARAVWGAAVGGLLGIFFGIPGLILGPFVGAVVGELTVRREWRRAGRVGLGTWLGVALGTVAKIALVVAMLGVFGFSWFA